MYKQFALLFSTWLAVINLTAQASHEPISEKKLTKYGVVWQPSATKNSVGLTIGFLGQDAICNAPYPLTSYGINMQLIGQGFVMQSFILPNKNYLSSPSLDSNYRSSTHGIQLSLTGTNTERVNGLSISGLSSHGSMHNGLAVNLILSSYKKFNGISAALLNESISFNGVQIGLHNSTDHGRGVQIGLVNRCHESGPVQLGLWNSNNKRNFPFINL